MFSPIIGQVIQSNTISHTYIIDPAIMVFDQALIYLLYVSHHKSKETGYKVHITTIKIHFITHNTHHIDQTCLNVNNSHQFFMLPGLS